ncbi:MAG: argininosuccinate lyase [Lentisphaerae bacterium]|nr:argininosuccinate lyase [Lentisphaerota bacterium]
MTTRKTIVGEIDSRVLSFTVGRDPVLDLNLVEADCIGTAAHVTMLAGLKLKPALLRKSDRDAVVAALVDVIRSARRGAFRITDEDQDVHLAVERTLTRKLGDLGKRVHTGRSRNDQVAVDLRIYAREELVGLMIEMAGLSDALLSLASKNRDVPMVGRTHLQPAMPSSVGLWASSHAEALLEDGVLVRAAYVLNDACPLGSAAGYGVPLPLDRAATARLLGFSRAHSNVLHASNARGRTEAAVLGALAHLAVTLSRLSEDLILYSMPEFGYFTLPSAFCTGSSIMPQKRNPDVLELVRARAASALGRYVAVMGVIKGLPGGYNRDLQETKEHFIEGVRAARESLRVLAPLAGGVAVNKSALLAGFRPEVFATDEALEHVARGLPFREAYDKVKAGLESVGLRDPSRLVKERNRRAPPFDLGALRASTRIFRRDAEARRRACHRRISALLGVAYPSLKAGGRK